MKRIAALCLGLCWVVSCVTVDDFGAYWFRASTDPQLAGNWKRVLLADDVEPDLGRQIIKVVKLNDAYSLELLDSVNNSNPAEKLIAKTLRVGPYDFLALGPTGGAIYRYERHGAALDFYVVNGENFAVFLNKNYPSAANIRMSDEGSAPEIRRFDAQVFEILANVPKTNDYWDRSMRFQRLR